MKRFSRHPYTRARRAIDDLSLIGRVQFFCELARTIVELPPRDWINSERSIPSREEVCAALIRQINAIEKEVPHG